MVEISQAARQVQELFHDDLVLWTRGPSDANYEYTNCGRHGTASHRCVSNNQRIRSHYFIILPGLLRIAGFLKLFSSTPVRCIYSTMLVWLCSTFMLSQCRFKRSLLQSLSMGTIHVLAIACSFPFLCPLDLQNFAQFVFLRRRLVYLLANW
jgi:hypothetical protein